MSTAERELMDYLNETDDTAIQAQSTSFVVDSIEKADWCLRKLALIEKADAEDRAVAEREIERIQTWLAERTKARESSRNFFQDHLRNFHAQVLSEDTKQKTIKLPHGVLKSRTVQPSARKVDDSELLACVKDLGMTEYIQVKELVMWSELKKAIQVVPRGDGYVAIDENGNIISGVEVDFGGTTYTVEVDA